jgi:hypothetical protein
VRTVAAVTCTATARSSTFCRFLVHT